MGNACTISANGSGEVLDPQEPTVVTATTKAEIATPLSAPMTRANSVSRASPSAPPLKLDSKKTTVTESVDPIQIVHRDPMLYAKNDQQAIPAAGPDSDASDDGIVRSLERELSSFRKDVAAAVVETAEILSGLRAEVRELRQEQLELRAWKADHQKQAHAAVHQHEKLQKATKEMVESHMKLHTQVQQAIGQIADIREDVRGQRELTAATAANADAACNDVNNIRITLLEIEQMVSRANTQVGTMEATLRSCTREQASLTGEIRSVKADVSILQGRFERQRVDLALR
jgi:predicted  nucleic acid-binding Zn-ribbon protein